MNRSKWMKKHLKARRHKLRGMRFRRALSILSLGAFAVADIFIPGSKYVPAIRAAAKIAAAEALRRKRKELKENA